MKEDRVTAGELRLCPRIGSGMAYIPEFFVFRAQVPLPLHDALNYRFKAFFVFREA